MSALDHEECIECLHARIYVAALPPELGGEAFAFSVHDVIDGVVRMRVMSPQVAWLPDVVDPGSHSEAVRTAITKGRHLGDRSCRIYQLRWRSCVVEPTTFQNMGQMWARSVFPNGAGPVSANEDTENHLDTIIMHVRGSVHSAFQSSFIVLITFCAHGLSSTIVFLNILRRWPFKYHCHQTVLAQRLSTIIDLRMFCARGPSDIYDLEMFCAHGLSIIIVCFGLLCTRPLKHLGLKRLCAHRSNTNVLGLHVQSASKTQLFV